MSVTYSYGPGTYNVGQLSDELVAAGVSLITVRGSGTANIDVVCNDGQVAGPVNTAVASHSAAFPTPVDSTHKHSGADLTSGTVATARLGSGTANSTTFLRGDQAWSTP